MAPDESPEVTEVASDEDSVLPTESLANAIARDGLRPEDPRKLTSRERRRRLILLAILALLLLLLSYLAYYYTMNRRMPSLGLAPAGSDYIEPPRYLYSISADGAQSLVRPVGVGVADDGRVYVVDFGHRRVSVFSNPGRYLFSFDTTADGKLVNAVHLVINDGEVWVSERSNRTIYVFDLEGNYLRKFVPKNEPDLKWTPLAFSFDASGALRVTDVGDTNNHRLHYFSVDGSRTATIGKTAQVNSLQEQPGTFLFPNGVAVDAKGEVYVSDGDNRRVQVFDPNGAFLRFIDTSGVPRGIAIDQKSRLYVADALAHTVSVFDLKGKMLTQFGERGFGPGQFNYPNDIAIDRRGRIYITDRENGQVQVWGWSVAQIPPVPVPKTPLAWLAALACCLPLILLPLLLLARRKVRVVVTPEFMDALELVGEIRPTAEKARVRLIAPEEDLAHYEGRVVDSIVLTDLLTFEEYSESDARALMEKYKITQRPAMLLSMAWRAKALATDDNDLRLLALLAEIRTVDVKEFREIYLKRDVVAEEVDGE